MAEEDRGAPAAHPLIPEGEELGLVAGGPGEDQQADLGGRIAVDDAERLNAQDQLRFAEEGMDASAEGLGAQHSDHNPTESSNHWHMGFLSFRRIGLGSSQ